MPHIKIHTAILSKMDAYIKNNNIPNIIFHGPTGSGKKYIINSVIDKLYSSADATARVMYVNCAHGKGIKFIRDDLKLFSKTNILNANGPGFKTVVLVNADKLTIDAQSALRRCIELFSHSTRFFISVENIDKLRGTETSLYTKKIKAQGPFYRGTSKHILKLKTQIETRLPVGRDRLVEFSNILYEKGYSAQDIVSCAKIHNVAGMSSKNVTELAFMFHKVKREFRNEPTLILFVIDFLFFRNNTNLENVAII
jgi:hypothetical protein